MFIITLNQGCETDPIQTSYERRPAGVDVDAIGVFDYAIELELSQLIHEESFIPVLYFITGRC